jgi:proline iminopeptidase
VPDAPPEPRASTLLVADGYEVYVERVGRPGGVPLIYCHGGPGSGTSVNQRRLFHPDLFDVILFDQRGTGRGSPLAEGASADLTTNTTHHLIADMETIRGWAGVDRWIVAGISWGSTLALAYAEAHPDVVTGVLVGLVTTTSAAEVDWITRGVGQIFPAEYDRFTTFIPASLSHLSNVDAYGEMLTSGDTDLEAAAAFEWCLWEDAHVSLAPGHIHNTRYDDPTFRLRFARLVTHYWRHHAFLGSHGILDAIGTIAHLPAVMIHGRFDVSSPLYTPWDLHRRWPASELVILDRSGHGDGDDFRPAWDDAQRRLAVTAT